MRGIANIVSLLVLTLLWGGEAFPRNRGFPIASVKSYVVRKPFLVLRGGGDIALEVDEDSDEIEDLDDEDNEEEDEVDEEEEEELDPVLTKSTLKSRTKVHAKKATETKQAVSAKLKTKTKKRGGGLLKVLRVPYIIRACLNPVTLFTMTRAYFASLFNISYMKEDTSQTLRSALEDKAKKSGGTSRKGKRQMRPGQAKTLSDLPQLSS